MKYFKATTKFYYKKRLVQTKYIDEIIDDCQPIMPIFNTTTTNCFKQEKFSITSLEISCTHTNICDIKSIDRMKISILRI